MPKFKEFINEAKGDAGHHKYSKNTIEELELLLKHHKEDIEEYKEDGECDKETILHDIEEIEAAIKAKKATNETEIVEDAKTASALIVAIKATLGTLEKQVEKEDSKGSANSFKSVEQIMKDLKKHI